MDIEELFKKYTDEYMRFDRVEKKRSTRPDLHAFLLLDELFPSHSDIISDAQHDTFFLGIDYEEIEKLTKDQIVELIRCGVRYDEDSLCMFS